MAARAEDPTDLLDIIRLRVAQQIELVNQRRAAKKAELERVKIVPARNAIANIDNDINLRRVGVVEKLDKQQQSAKEQHEKYIQTQQEVKDKIAELQRQLVEIDEFKEENNNKLDQLSIKSNHQLQELEAARIRRKGKHLADIALAESEWHERDKWFKEQIAAKKLIGEQTITSVEGLWAEESPVDESISQPAQGSQTVRNPPTQTDNLLSISSPNSTKLSNRKGSLSPHLDENNGPLANIYQDPSAGNNGFPSSLGPSPMRPRGFRASSEISEVHSEIFVSNINSNINDDSSTRGGYHNGAENDFGFVFTISGGYYTSPDCMKGVPVARITEQSDYWESSWTNARTCIEEEKQSPREVENSLKWLAENCSMHPNQLISKDYYDKKGLLNRNYIIALRKIFQNLYAADIGDPVKWLRIRLAQIIQEREGKPGVGFRLKQTIYGLKRNHTEYIGICKVNSFDGTHSETKAKSAKQGLKPKIRRSDTNNSPSNPYSKRGQYNVHLSPPQRPIKIQRIETRASNDIYNFPSRDASCTTLPRNTFSSQHAPSPASPVNNSPTSRRSQTQRAQPMDLHRRANPSFRIPKYQASFDLSFFRCGINKWEKPNCAIRMRLNAETKIFDPYNGDASLLVLQPELAIKPRDVVDLGFQTRYDQGDTVMLQRARKPGETGWAGDGTKMILAFKHPDDADKFAVLLYKLNGDIKMTETDRKRLILHMESESGVLQANDRSGTLRSAA